MIKMTTLSFSRIRSAAGRASGTRPGFQNETDVLLGRTSSIASPYASCRSLICRSYGSLVQRLGMQRVLQPSPPFIDPFLNLGQRQVEGPLAAAPLVFPWMIPVTKMSCAGPSNA